MLTRTLAALALLTASTLSLAADFVAGRDYSVVPLPGRVEKPGMIEVREFFWYGCGHCYKLEPYVKNWLKTKPANVNFVRTPAALNPVWEQNARAYYAAASLGKADAAHEALFNAIHVRNQKLFDQASLAKFYGNHGVDAKSFSGLYNSFVVTGKVAQSNNLAKQYRLDGVPALVVNGKYVVKGDSGRSLDVVRYLIAQEQSKAGKK